MEELAILLDGIAKHYGDAVAVKEMSLSVRRGEFVCLLGPSGCGKTTTLRMVAGFVEPDRGRILIGGADMAERAPNRRDIGMVYQSYALFPHMSVFENVAFGLKMRGVRPAELRQRVASALALVRLDGLAARRPRELSGGQQQRVALARAIVISPTVLLLDEPLSNLDAKLRKEMQLELKTLQRGIGLTTLHVTHDQEEALLLADTVVIMNRGAVEQIGTPREVYASPRNSFVADFLGKSNFLNGHVRECDRSRGLATVATDDGEVLTVEVAEDLAVGTPVDLFIRPERVQLGPAGAAPAPNTLQLTVRRVNFLGATVSIEATTAGGRRLTIDRPGGGPEEALRQGDTIAATLPAAQLRPLQTS